jgi:hypothetical protein
VTVLRFPRPFILSDRLNQTSTLKRCRLSECHGACCLHGVWLDPLERDDILSHANRILPHMPVERTNPKAWFGVEQESEPAFPSGIVIPSAVLPNPPHYGGTECVFLRSDSLCALQVAAENAGFDPWRWKPFHCIVHPLTFDTEGRITLASDEELLAEKGSCFRAGKEPRPIRDWLTAEITFLDGVTQD